MAYFDNKLPLVGHLGFTMGYVNGLIRRVKAGGSVKLDDLEVIKVRLENIEKYVDDVEEGNWSDFVTREQLENHKEGSYIL